MRKNLDILDLTKFILAIFIIIIHTKLIPIVFFPLVRLGVPLFFIISSYLLFTKINSSPAEKKWDIIKHYIIRQLKLYAFYLILLSYIIILYKNYIPKFNKYGLWLFILKFISDLLFNSTFGASWFIAASVISVPIIAFLTEKLPGIAVQIICIIFLLWACYGSSTRHIFPPTPTVRLIYMNYKMIFHRPYYSFPLALIYILIGKLFADGKNKQFSLPVKLIFLVLSMGLLYTECFYIHSLCGVHRCDTYISLVPACYFIFDTLKDINIHLKYAKQMRLFSVMAFATNASFAFITRKFILFNVNDPQKIFAFLITVAMCFIFYIIIIYLEKFKYLKWLKYAH